MPLGAKVKKTNILRRVYMEYYEPHENSDKFYEIEIVETNGGYDVEFNYGRNGSGPLHDGNKNMSPVSLSEANKIFDKLMESKIKKGYEVVEEEG